MSRNTIIIGALVVFASWRAGLFGGSSTQMPAEQPNATTEEPADGGSTTSGN